MAQLENYSSRAHAIKETSRQDACGLLDLKSGMNPVGEPGVAICAIVPTSAPLSREDEANGKCDR